MFRSNSLLRCSQAVINNQLGNKTSGTCLCKLANCNKKYINNKGVQQSLSGDSLLIKNTTSEIITSEISDNKTKYLNVLSKIDNLNKILNRQKHGSISYNSLINNTKKSISQNDIQLSTSKSENTVNKTYDYKRKYVKQLNRTTNIAESEDNVIAKFNNTFNCNNKTTSLDLRKLKEISDGTLITTNNKVGKYKSEGSINRMAIHNLNQKQKTEAIDKKDLDNTASLSQISSLFLNKNYFNEQQDSQIFREITNETKIVYTNATQRLNIKIKEKHSSILNATEDDPEIKAGHSTYTDSLNSQNIIGHRKCELHSTNFDNSKNSKTGIKEEFDYKKKTLEKQIKCFTLPNSHNIKTPNKSNIRFNLNEEKFMNINLLERSRYNIKSSEKYELPSDEKCDLTQSYKCAKLLKEKPPGQSINAKPFIIFNNSMITRKVKSLTKNLIKNFRTTTVRDTKNQVQILCRKQNSEKNHLESEKTFSETEYKTANKSIYSNKIEDYKIFNGNIKDQLSVNKLILDDYLEKNKDKGPEKPVLLVSDKCEFNSIYKRKMNNVIERDVETKYRAEENCMKFNKQSSISIYNRKQKYHYDDSKHNPLNTDHKPVNKVKNKKIENYNTNNTRSVNNLNEFILSEDINQIIKLKNQKENERKENECKNSNNESHKIVYNKILEPIPWEQGAHYETMKGKLHYSLKHVVTDTTLDDEKELLATSWQRGRHYERLKGKINFSKNKCIQRTNNTLNNQERIPPSEKEQENNEEIQCMEHDDKNYHNDQKEKLNHDMHPYRSYEKTRPNSLNNTTRGNSNSISAIVSITNKSENSLLNHFHEKELIAQNNKNYSQRAYENKIDQDNQLKSNVQTKAEITNKQNILQEWHLKKSDNMKETSLLNLDDKNLIKTPLKKDAEIKTNLELKTVSKQTNINDTKKNKAIEIGLNKAIPWVREQDILKSDNKDCNQISHKPKFSKNNETNFEQVTNLTRSSKATHKNSKEVACKYNQNKITNPNLVIKKEVGFEPNLNIISSKLIGGVKNSKNKLNKFKNITESEPCLSLICSKEKDQLQRKSNHNNSSSKNFKTLNLKETQSLSTEINNGLNKATEKKSNKKDFDKNSTTARKNSKSTIENKHPTSSNDENSQIEICSKNYDSMAKNKECKITDSMIAIKPNNNEISNNKPNEIAKINNAIKNEPSILNLKEDENKKLTEINSFYNNEEHSKELPKNIKTLDIKNEEIRSIEIDKTFIECKKCKNEINQQRKEAVKQTPNLFSPVKVEKEIYIDHEKNAEIKMNNAKQNGQNHKEQKNKTTAKSDNINHTTNQNKNDFHVNETRQRDFALNEKNNKKEKTPKKIDKISNKKPDESSDKPIETNVDTSIYAQETDKLNTTLDNLQKTAAKNKALSKDKLLNEKSIFTEKENNKDPNNTEINSSEMIDVGSNVITKLEKTLTKINSKSNYVNPPNKHKNEFHINKNKQRDLALNEKINKKKEMTNLIDKIINKTPYESSDKLIKTNVVTSMYAQETDKQKNELENKTLNKDNELLHEKSISVEKENKKDLSKTKINSSEVIEDINNNIITKLETKPMGIKNTHKQLLVQVNLKELENNRPLRIQTNKHKEDLKQINDKKPVRKIIVGKKVSEVENKNSKKNVILELDNEFYNEADNERTSYLLIKTTGKNEEIYEIQFKVENESSDINNLNKNKDDNEDILTGENNQQEKTELAITNKMNASNELEKCSRVEKSDLKTDKGEISTEFDCNSFDPITNADRMADFFEYEEKVLGFNRKPDDNGTVNKSLEGQKATLMEKHNSQDKETLEAFQNRDNEFFKETLKKTYEKMLPRQSTVKQNKYKRGFIEVLIQEESANRTSESTPIEKSHGIEVDSKNEINKNLLNNATELQNQKILKEQPNKKTDLKSTVSEKIEQNHFTDIPGSDFKKHPIQNSEMKQKHNGKKENINVDINQIQKSKRTTQEQTYKSASMSLLQNQEAVKESRHGKSEVSKKFESNQSVAVSEKYLKKRSFKKNQTEIKNNVKKEQFNQNDNEMQKLKCTIPEQVHKSASTGILNTNRSNKTNENNSLKLRKDTKNLVVQEGDKENKNNQQSIKKDFQTHFNKNYIDSEISITRKDVNEILYTDTKKHVEKCSEQQNSSLDIDMLKEIYDRKIKCLTDELDVEASVEGSIKPSELLSQKNKRFLENEIDFVTDSAEILENKHITVCVPKKTLSAKSVLVTQEISSEKLQQPSSIPILKTMLNAVVYTILKNDNLNDLVTSLDKDKQQNFVPKNENIVVDEKESTNSSKTLLNEIKSIKLGKKPFIMNYKQFPMINNKRSTIQYPLQKTEIITNNDQMIYKHIPSVSKILNETLPQSIKADLHQWEYNQSSTWGKAQFQELFKEQLKNDIQFHDCIRRHISGTPMSILKENVSPRIKGSLNSLDNIISNITNVAVLESPVVHPDLPYHGIVDCVANYNNTPVLIEWKQADKPKSIRDLTNEAAIQLSAYIGAINNDQRYKFQIKSGIIVMAYTDGSPADILTLSNEECEDYWKLWLQRMEKYINSRN